MRCSRGERETSALFIGPRGWRLDCKGLRWILRGSGLRRSGAGREARPAGVDEHEIANVNQRAERLCDRKDDVAAQPGVNEQHDAAGEAEIPERKRDVAAFQAFGDI